MKGRNGVSRCKVIGGERQTYGEGFKRRVQKHTIERGGENTGLMNERKDWTGVDGRSLGKGGEEEEDDHC